MKISAVVLCAGSSLRFGSDKMSLPFGGVTVREASVAAFSSRRDISEVIVVAPAEALDAYRAAFPTCTVVAGGNTRQESVICALPYVGGDYVLIHDGARPNVSPAVIDRVIEALSTHPAVVPVVDIADSVIYEGRYVDRQQVKRVQTPQGFRTDLLRQYIPSAPADYTDEGSLIAQYCSVLWVEGDVENAKLTHPVDYYGLSGEMRTGAGYDIHRLERGRRLVLCGVEIPYDKGAVAHSDGDCCLHAVMDAMLSAVGLADIGHYFPNTAEWKGADSADLLAIVRGELTKLGASVVNVSMSVVCERPKLAPYLGPMKARLATLLGIAEHSIGISVTTNEGVAMHVDDLVTGDAVAAFATALVRIRV